MTAVMDPDLTSEDLIAHNVAFDPTRHVLGDDGRPVKTRNGYFKRRDDVPKQRPATARPAAPKLRPGEPDYRSGILGLMQVAAVPLTFVAPADAAALVMHAPPIAEALHQLACDRPEVARVLDVVLSVGPYGAVLAACLPLVVQVLHNHGAIERKMAHALGAVPKEELLASIGVDDGTPAEQQS